MKDALDYYYLDEECKDQFTELQNLLNDMNIPFVVDTGIVRADYYTKTVFEINGGLYPMCGGRYDNLIYEIDEK